VQQTLFEAIALVRARVLVVHYFADLAGPYHSAVWAVPRPGGGKVESPKGEGGGGGTCTVAALAAFGYKKGEENSQHDTTIEMHEHLQDTS